jgi:hypothetical protein
MHLRAGESNPVVFLHGFDHVVDEFLNSRTLDISTVDRTSLGPQDGVAHVRDFQNRHDLRIILGRTCTNYTPTTSRTPIGIARGADMASKSAR